MGCASSKSTPTVENTTDTDNLPQTLLNNGKAMAMKVQEEVSNQVDHVKNDLKDALSIKSNTNNDATEDESESDSPTQRVEKSVDDEMNIDDMKVPSFTNEEMNMESADNDDKNTIPQAAIMENMDDRVVEKPSTPMPENLFDSNPDTDSEEYTTGKSIYGDSQSMRSPNDTVNSKMMKAVCSSAAKAAMDDSDADSRTSRNTRRNFHNTIDSRVLHSDVMLSDSEDENGENYPAITSSAFSTFEKIPKGKKGKRQHDDRHGRTERIKRRENGGSGPCTELSNDGRTKANAHHKRNMRFSSNGNVHWSKNSY